MLIPVIIKMHYLCESVLVGLYSSFIYFLVSGLRCNFAYLLFITGFLKHMLGYYTGIHDYYCNNGYACKKATKCGTTKCGATKCETTKCGATKCGFKRATGCNIILESVLEGVVFVIVGSLFSRVVSDKLCDVFLVGVFLHVVSEIIGLHNYFCRERCV
jgi:hypothetical protein